MHTLWLVVLALFEVTCGQVTIERISVERGLLSESPFWDDDTQTLYWLDIKGRTISKYNQRVVKTLRMEDAENDISGIIPIDGKQGFFVIGVGTDLREIEWSAENGMRSTTLTSVDLGLSGNRLNDAKCDKFGRLWIGTMGMEINMKVAPFQGSLFMIDDNNYLDPDVKISPVSISNGMAWTKDDKTYFYADSPSRVIAAYDYNLRTGDISNRTIFFDFDQYNISGNPDGLTIDTRDNLWIAVFGGSTLLKVGIDGRLLAQYPMPAGMVTSAMWGGPNLDILFVTTASMGLSKEQLLKTPGAGHVYAVTGLGEKGFKSNKFVAP